MCGLIGCVGAPLFPKESYILLSSLLEETQTRGPHATGHFLVTNEEENSSPIYFKSPIPASVYVNIQEWKDIENIKYKTLMAHTRYKTKGEELENNNNHPHISSSENIGLIHNGTLYDFSKHKSDYTLEGSSDSELILRMIVKENNIIKGINKVFDCFKKSGDFACMLTYRNPIDGKSRFLFFRDSGRPGRFIDAYDSLGQYFFCSTSQIWKDSVKKAEKLNDKIKKMKLLDLKIENIPSFEIWEIDAQTLDMKIHYIKKPYERKVKPKKPKLLKLPSVKDEVKINYRTVQKYKFYNYSYGRKI
ncbi:MAG: class II glutamine amidotransferase [Bacillota bacterium]